MRFLLYIGIMRLFIAIQFNDEIKYELLVVQNKLKKHLNGNFTRSENLHLTLVFLGEYDRKMQYQACLAMDSVKEHSFEVSLGRLGRFGKAEDGLIWIDMKPHDRLIALHKMVCDALDERNLPYDKKPFIPHITLVRRCGALPDNISAKGTAHQAVSKVSLMLSERKNGKLIYSELYSINLK